MRIETPCAKEVLCKPFNYRRVDLKVSDVRSKKCSFFDAEFRLNCVNCSSKINRIIITSFGYFVKYCESQLTKTEK